MNLLQTRVICPTHNAESESLLALVTLQLNHNHLLGGFRRVPEEGGGGGRGVVGGISQVLLTLPEVIKTGGHGMKVT